MALYQKYRPSTFDEVRENSETVEALKSMVGDLSKCPHVFLFHGPTGCGKTTLARILARELGCEGSDLREMDFADFRGIDAVREIKRAFQFKPLKSPCRFFIIDEAHKMTADAQEAFLKDLEDTPKHVYVALCTSEPSKLKPTLRGRCSQFQVNKLTEKGMTRLLKGIVKSEGAKLEPEIYETIVNSANGHSRNAIVVLEKVLSVSEDKRAEIAAQADFEIVQSIELSRALIKGAPWSQIAKILTSLKDQEPETIRRQVLGYAQSILLSGKADVRASAMLEEFLEPTYDSGFPQIVYACRSLTNK